ncbi:RsmB/NOP family class I SAM-dependent RNA methyltransferase [Oceanobacter antarcticus]|jgi:16S rRNA (cytosine967-C5)-methyltransferase|uniref:RsmB/NOP family class I SAM-dependent RNA methyltransferase n=1 Tax=Oceanobacter antarcticus TaxID=3133425 RepID=A0ABW8NKD1_9GAMM
MTHQDTFLITYSDLLTVWQDWLDTIPHPPLDRWLKQRAKYQKRYHGGYRMAIDNAMMDAMRYRQLADALEHSFQDPGFDDWVGWDQSWSPNNSTEAAPQHFWHWLQLRSEADWRTPEVAQQKARREHFIEFRQRVANTSDNALFMLWHGLRPSWEPALKRRAEKSGWNDDTLQHWIEQQTHRPPLWLRQVASQTKPDDESLERALKRDGVIVHQYPVTLGEHSYTLHAAEGGNDVIRSDAFKAGKVEIQDAASQLICEMVDVQPGQKIWDACAGAGGKTLTLASALGKKGAVIATDLHQYKLDELKKRAKRAAIANIRNFVWDGEAPLRLPIEIARQQGFDRILVDAPCTNAGTWRRNPDARWRLTAENTRELHQLQFNLLDRAAKSLRANGRLIYATCSWQVEENESVCGRFLEANPEFVLVQQTLLGAPLVDSDTMFCAVFSKA